jgi:hypothetical protein
VYTSGTTIRKASFRTQLFVAVCLLLTAGSLAAAPKNCDKNDDCSEYETIIWRVYEIANTISDAKSTISDNKIKTMITDARTMLQQALEMQTAGIGAFAAGDASCSFNGDTPCANFKHNLIYMLSAVEDLNNTIINYHSIDGLAIQLSDPGVDTLIKSLPAAATFPLFKVLDSLQLLKPELIQAIDSANVSLLALKDVVYPDLYQESISQTNTSLTTSTLTIPTDVCSIIETNPEGIRTASYSISGLAMVLRLIGGVMEAFGETVFAGPVEMDGGIHGYVHGTIKSNKLKKVGIGISTLGSTMYSVGSYGTNKITQCAMVQRQQYILANQASMLANQQEIIRLLLTPQGRRSSEYCEKPDCSFPAKK